MNILGIQIIATLFAIFMNYIAFLNWKRREISPGAMVFWTLLWIGFILITLYPKILESISQQLFFARIMDLLMIIAFMILAYLGYENYVSNKKMEKRIEEIVRREAISSLKLKKKNSKK